MSDDLPGRTLRAKLWKLSILESMMKCLPSPTTFAEGQRYVFGLLASASGMCCSAFAGLMIALLMWGGWSRSEEHTIVTIFGGSLAGFIGAMIVVIVGLLAGGPVGHFKVSATRDGASVEAEAEERP